MLEGWHPSSSSSLEMSPNLLMVQSSQRLLECEETVMPTTHLEIQIIVATKLDLEISNCRTCWLLNL